MHVVYIWIINPIISRQYHLEMVYLLKLQFDNYSYGKLTNKKSYYMSLHSSFRTQLLKDINAIKNGFHVTFQIQLISIKNNNGDTCIYYYY